MRWYCKIISVSPGTERESKNKSGFEEGPFFKTIINVLGGGWSLADLLHTEKNLRPSDTGVGARERSHLLMNAIEVKITIRTFVKLPWVKGEYSPQGV